MNIKLDSYWQIDYIVHNFNILYQTQCTSTNGICMPDIVPCTPDTVFCTPDIVYCMSDNVFCTPDISFNCKIRNYAVPRC